ncbi:MAG: Rpn family recombination-promoting nuclease/putative transposase [Lactobacillus kalixensis]
MSHKLSNHEKDILKRVKITNDAVFKWIMEQKDNCLKLIQAILPELNIKSIEFHAQDKLQEYEKSKSIIADVLAKDDKGRLYDIEMQQTVPIKLGKRFRYYQSVFDVSNIRPGKRYSDLIETYIIFIFKTDPFKYGYRKYTSKGIAFNEVDGLLLQNDTHLVMLNPTGTKGDVTPEMQQFFDLELGVLSDEDNYASQLQESMIDFSKDPERVKQMMTFEDKLNDVAAVKEQEGENKGRKQDSIKRLKSTIVMLKDLGISNEKIRSRMHQEYSDILSNEEIDEYLAVLDK